MSSAETSHSPKSAITLAAAAKYALLPGIFPRMRHLAQSFDRFFFMFIQMFATIGLIDPSHPCLKPQNLGLYRFRDMVGLAASNIRYTRTGLPQAVMFWVIISSIVLLIGLFVTMALSLFFYVGTSYAQFFSEPQGNSYTRDGDWTLQFLYRVFGEVGSMLPTASGGHNGWFGAIFMAALKHYSLAMLLIVVFMILYILIITATEAARTGQPFGTRFDGIWAPIRMALAIMLLIPVSGQGLNVAQLIVIQSAVWGSNLATNAWFSGIDAAGNQNLLSNSLADPGYRFVRDAFLINACIAKLQTIPNDTGSDWGGAPSYIMSFEEDSVMFSFGPPKAASYCGQATVGIIPSNLPGPGGTNQLPSMISEAYQEVFYSLLPISANIALPNAGSGVIADGIQRAGGNISGLADIPVEMKAFLLHMADEVGDLEVYDYSGIANTYGANAQTVMSWIDMYRDPLGYQDGSGFFSATGSGRNFTAALNAYNAWIIQSLKEDAQYGWASAGVFYIRLSGIMNTVSKIIDSAPRVNQLPINFMKAYASPNNPGESVEAVQAKCSSMWESFISIFGLRSEECKHYDLSLLTNSFLRSSNSWFQDVVKTDPAIYSELGASRFDQYLKIPDPESPDNIATDSVTKPVANHLFEHFRIDNQLNPLGAIISMGDSLFKLGFIAWGISIVAGSVGLGAPAWSLAILCFFCGFIMMFWVPFMPFLYFTFAIVEWIVSVMEAVIGMPLWATTLISLEGDGLGNGMEGVKMIFEIVLRPTIIILSLMVSVILFGASVHFINQAMALYANASDDLTNLVTQDIAASIGMVIVYVFVVFLLSQSCFKLITKIPDNFGRWAGLPAGFGSMIGMGPEAISGIAGFVIGGALMGGISSTMGGVTSFGKAAKEKGISLGKMISGKTS